MNTRRKNSTLYSLFCMLSLGFYAQAQTLSAYLEIAEKNNPALQALQYAYKASKEGVNGARSLPNTRLGMGYFVSEPETRVGAQKAKFFVRQDIPWFGSLKANTAKAYAESEIQGNAYRIGKKKVALQVKQNYYNLYAIRVKKKVLEQKKIVLKNYHEIALNALENNKATAVDVLRITMAQNELDNLEEQLKGAELNSELAFHKVLNTDGFEALTTPENLAITEEEQAMAYDEIMFHPEVLVYDHLDSLVQQKHTVNSKDRMPSFGVGLEYVLVEERPDLNVQDNGKDIMMPTVSLSIPIFSKTYSSRSKQYDLEQEALQQQRIQTENELQKAMETAMNDRITARINYDTQLKNIIQAKQAEEILLTNYETGILVFEDLLDIQQLLLDFELKKIDAIKAYFLQTALLNYMTE